MTKNSSICVSPSPTLEDDLLSIRCAQPPTGEIEARQRVVAHYQPIIRELFQLGLIGVRGENYMEDDTDHEHEINWIESDDQGIRLQVMIDCSGGCCAKPLTPDQ